ncbi:MAG: hypothetical protein AB7H97_07690 [Pseudobdellovibrionaceae bacterium]
MAQLWEIALHFVNKKNFFEATDDDQKFANFTKKHKPIFLAKNVFYLSIFMTLEATA